MLSDSSGWPARLIGEYVPSEISIARRVSLGWLQDALPLAAVGLTLALLWGVLGLLTWAEFPGTRRSHTVGPLTGYVALLATVTATAAAIAVALLQLGLISADPRIPGGSEVGSVLAALSWHLLDAVPGLEVNATLNWSLAHDLVGRGSGILLLAHKAAFLGILLFPVARNLEMALRRRPPPSTGALQAARRFSQLMDSINTTLDRLESLVLREDDGDTESAGASQLPPSRRVSPRPLVVRRWQSPMAAGPTGSRSPLMSIYRGAREAQRGLGELHNEFDHVAALFGDGEVTEKARLSLGALDRRFDAIQEMDPFAFDVLEPHVFGSRPSQEDLRRVDEETAMAEREFWSAMAAAFDEIKHAPKEVRNVYEAPHPD